MLGEKQFFIWKSKAQIAAEDAAYAQWAFPYGETQRQNLEALLAELFPKERIPNVLVPFLTAKELYERDKKDRGSVDAVVDYMINMRKKYKSVLPKKMMPIMIALAIADENLDPETLQYPTAQEIRDTEARFEAMRKTK